MEMRDLEGRLLALVLMGETEEGNDDWILSTGIVRADDSRWYLDRGAERERFRIRSEWINRIRPVNDEIKDVLGGALFVLSLSVGNLPDDADIGEYEDTGLKWPA